MLNNILNIISTNDVNTYTKLHHYVYEFIETKYLEQLKASKTNDDLFVNAFNLGIFPIVAYLYENANIRYNYSLLTNFNSNLSSGVTSDNIAVVETGSTNTSCRLQIIDKYYNFKVICYNYLQSLKKYSTMTSSNKNFYYKLNRQVNSESYLNQWLNEID